MALTGPPSPVLLGSTAGYTVSVRNDGPNRARETKLTLTVPSGLTIDSVSGRRCSSLGAIAACDLRGLYVGEVERVTLVVRATQPYYLSVTASVSAATADPNAANNAATTTTAVSSSLGSAAATGDFASSAATLGRAAGGRERSVVFTVQNLGAALTAGVALAQNNVADAAAVSSPG